MKQRKRDDGFRMSDGLLVLMTRIDVRPIDYESISPTSIRAADFKGGRGRNKVVGGNSGLSKKRARNYPVFARRRMSRCRPPPQSALRNAVKSAISCAVNPILKRVL
jgi:hypothetical protein